MPRGLATRFIPVWLETTEKNESNAIPESIKKNSGLWVAGREKPKKITIDNRCKNFKQKAWIVFVSQCRPIAKLVPNCNHAQLLSNSYFLAEASYSLKY